MTETLVADDREVMTAKLFFNAAFPVMQVLLDDDPTLRTSFADVVATVQFGARSGDGLLACHLAFDHGRLEVQPGPADAPDLTLTFASVPAMNALLRGGLALPRITGGLRNPVLLVKMLKLLMGLMIMSPKQRPKSFDKQALKVKASLYMVTRALSQYNKLGDPDMREFCGRQPDRIYQFTVEHDGDPAFIACFLRVKAGQSRSGHGVYARRSPFVHFRFLSVEGALAVLLKEVEFVAGVEQGYVETIGSPEYALALNDFMSVLQARLT